MHLNRITFTKIWFKQNFPETQAESCEKLLFKHERVKSECITG